MLLYVCDVTVCPGSAWLGLYDITARSYLAGTITNTVTLVGL
jgi:hypothetical protein